MTRGGADRGIASVRLQNQQLVRPRFSEAAELVRWFGAVQAQDYVGSLWAVGQRLSGAVEGDLEAAVASGAIVRTWPMRSTLHFVAAADVRWMLGLLAPRLLSSNVGRHRQLELDGTAFARARKILTRSLRGGGRLTRAAAYAALQRGGVSTTGLRGVHIVAQLAQEGVICFGPRDGRQPTFALLEEWISPMAAPSRDEALARLATAYFRSHGPATLQDFAWWSGLFMKEARAAIQEAGVAIAGETRGGRTLFTVAGTASRPGTRPSVALLPPWDEYVVAYKDREAALGHLTALPPMVIGNSLLVIDGRVRGTWKRVLAPSKVSVGFDFWSEVSGAEERAAARAAVRYGRFLEKGVEIVIRSGGRRRP
jgi:hypothetical protein